MELMQYKEFVFPHNPASITVEAPGRHALQFCPGYGELTQSLGPGVRRIRCRGSFLGHTPQAAAALVGEFGEKTAHRAPGVLVVPGFGVITAFLVSFTWEATGAGNAIPYEMQFLEAGAGDYS